MTHDKEQIIKRMEAVYSHQVISVRTFCEMVFYIVDNYNDPNLYLRVFDALLHRDDNDGSGPGS